ncbi:Uncharacterised protein [Halioglobus japonicus]|nr:Uncharacterised protein [Halioglobus japonicus]
MRSLILATTLLFSALSFAQAGPYSASETPIGILLDDPAAMAVVEEYIPGFSSNAQLDMARGMTLVDIQVYSPEPLSDEEMEALNADLAALPAN